MEETFLLRSAREDDLEDLYRLSKDAYFINLPADRELLKEKIRISTESFSDNVPDKFAREYIFVLENCLDQTLIGTSMIIARHGNPTSPHMYFQLKEIQKYSETIHAGFIHKVLRLKFDHDGPTEVGGIIVDPNFRRHKAKLGRQLSYVRFLFIKMRRRWFKNWVIAELMPPLMESGESVLWEALGRRFTNLSYQEADALSRKNKEFVTSLFPKGDIYTVLLPGEARDAIGKVGEEAEPVRHMLERIGFRWREHIDPFDGGPHYWAEVDKIRIIQETCRRTVHREILKRKSKQLVLCGILSDQGFLCIQTPFEILKGSVSLPKNTLDSLGLTAKNQVYIMPLEGTARLKLPHD